MTIEPRNIDDFVVVRQEAYGGTKKDWVADPSMADPQWNAVYKPSRSGTKNRSELEPHAELAAHKISSLLGIPSAKIELVSRHEEVGCISWDVRSSHESNLAPGISLLRGKLQNYEESGPVSLRDPIHRFDNIATALDQVEPPRDAHPTLNALDCFIGYMLFDALIGNDDRHGNNWAIERDSSTEMRLAPTFDHGSSLGIIAREHGANRFIIDGAAFAKYRAANRARRYADCRDETSRMFAISAFRSRASTEARSHWRQVFNDLDPKNLVDAIYTSGISGAMGKFASKLVIANLDELMEGMDP